MGERNVADRAGLGSTGVLTETEPLVAVSAAFQGVLDKARVIASSPYPVLLLGETGVGKERVARFIHAHGPRRTSPFIAVNCAGIPGTLILSEMFGHVRGAFTGADSDALGHLRAAAGGTLLLDEVGDLPTTAQAAMLRALDRLEVYPVGSTHPYILEARVIAATNRDLSALVGSGGLRRDLYERLACHVVTIPPLRERREDIIPIAEAILESMRQRGEADGQLLGPDIREALLAHNWPGNVRELRNAVMATVYERVTTGVRDIARFPSRGDVTTIMGEIACLQTALEREPRPIEVAAFAALRKRGRTSIASLARALDRDEDSVGRALRSLISAGLVVKGGKGRGAWIRPGPEEGETAVLRH